MSKTPWSCMEIELKLRMYRSPSVRSCFKRDCLKKSKSTLEESVGSVKEGRSSAKDCMGSEELVSGLCRRR